MTSPRYYSGQEVLDIAREVIVQHGLDFVYERRPISTGVDIFTNGCDYVRDGQPSCLMAQIANRMGAPVEFLVQFEGSGSDALFGYAPHWDDRKFPDNPYFRVSQETSNILGSVQAQQDSGSSWGLCLEILTDVLGGQD